MGGTTKTVEELMADIWPAFQNIRSKARRDVLMKLEAEYGVTRFLGTCRGIMMACEHGDYDEAAEEIMDLTWPRKRLDEQRELAATMRRGFYPDRVD